MSPFIEDSDPLYDEEPKDGINRTNVNDGSGQLDIVDLLTQVAETYDLPSVQFIKLKIMTKDLPLHSLNVYLPGLKELDLDNSNINSLRELGAEMGGLQILRINKCRLESLDGILSFKNLKEFSASNNYISNVGLIGQLEFLTFLDLSRNMIPEWEQLSFLKDCEFLEHLRFYGNPGSSSKTYKNEVIKLLPQLKTLDGTPTDPTLDSKELVETPFKGATLEKTDRKLLITSDFCGNIATALAHTKKQQKLKEEEKKSRKFEKPKSSESDLILSAAEQWRTTFKAYLKERAVQDK